MRPNQLILETDKNRILSVISLCKTIFKRQKTPKIEDLPVLEL